MLFLTHFELFNYPWFYVVLVYFWYSWFIFKHRGTSKGWKLLIPAASWTFETCFIAFFAGGLSSKSVAVLLCGAYTVLMIAYYLGGELESEARTIARRAAHNREAFNFWNNAINDEGEGLPTRMEQRLFDDLMQNVPLHTTKQNIINKTLGDYATEVTKPKKQ